MSETRNSIAVGIALTTDPERSRGQLEELCRCLSDAIGIKVTAHGMWHYHHLLEALTSGDLDVVWLPPVLALRATATRACVPIALPVRHGVSTYSTALFTRPDSGIRGIGDLHGLRAAWVDQQSAAGYLIIRALLRSQGVNLEHAFRGQTFLGTHDRVAAAVLAGEADVGATFVYLDSDTRSGPPRAAGWGDASVHIVCYAGAIPSDVIAANQKLDPELRSRVQNAWVSPDNDELRRAAKRLIGADRFVAPEPEHLKSLDAILDNLEGPAGVAHTAFPPPVRRR